MKYILLLALAGLLYSCKKEKVVVYANEGTITGIDLRECPCLAQCPCACGSLVFHFTDGTDSSRMIIDNPAIFQLPDNPRFPVHVKLNWQNTSRCNMKAVKVTDYATF